MSEKSPLLEGPIISPPLTTIGSVCIIRGMKTPYLFAGQKFSHLTAIDDIMLAKSLADFRCDCGNIKTTMAIYVTRGSTLSCGCAPIQRANPNSRRNSHYRIWEGMKQRCLNPTHTYYHRYGGRGIKICDRWLESFDNFVQDMGPRPEGMTLDRIDNDGDYTPENCRWANQSQQGNNTSTNHRITAFGEEKTVTHWSQDSRCAVSYHTLSKRLEAGWDSERAIVQPLPTPKIHYAFGEGKTVAEWSADARCIVSKHTLAQRLSNLKWSVEKALTEPPRRK